MVTALTGVLTASQRYMRDQTVKIVLLLCLCASPFPFCMNLTEKLDFFNSTASLRILLCILLIVHFTVTGGNEAGVDLDFIRPFLLYYVNAFSCKLVFLSKLSMRKGGRFVSKQGQSQPRFHSKARILSLQL